MLTKTKLTKEQLEEFFKDAFNMCEIDSLVLSAIKALCLHGLSVLPRPIEEAPKDGSAMLLRVGNKWVMGYFFMVQLGYWLEKGGVSISPTHFIPLSAFVAPVATASEKK